MKISVVEEESPKFEPKTEPKKETKEEKVTVEEKTRVEEKPKNYVTEQATRVVKTKNNSDKLPFWFILLAFALGLALGAGIIGGIFYFKTQMDKIPQTTPTPTAKSKPTGESLESLLTPASSASPSSTPSAKLDLKKYKVQILNGSGIKGEAGKVETLLTTAGFTNLDTGNSTTFDYTDTIISSKKATPEEVLTIINSALKSYKLKTGDPLTTTSKYDVVINVGKTKV